MPHGDHGRAAAFTGGIDLAEDLWILSLQWNARPDDLASCAQRLWRFLTVIGELDPRLRHWFHDSDKVDVDLDKLMTHLTLGEDPDDPSGQHGWTTSIWNGVNDDLAVSTISIACGRMRQGLKNSIEFNLPSPKTAPQLYEADAMRKLLEYATEVWRPQWSCVGPRSLWTAATATGDSLGVLAAWMVYLDADLLARVDPLPSPTRLDTSPDGDILLSLAPTIEELSLATVTRVRDSVQFQPEWSRLG
jgi:hypothetical protein